MVEFPGNRLFVEQACSGVQSLFSLWHSLSTGQHEAIGYALLLLFVWLLMSTDLFLVFVLGPFSSTKPFPTLHDFTDLDSQITMSSEP